MSAPGRSQALIPEHGSAHGGPVNVTTNGPVAERLAAPLPASTAIQRHARASSDFDAKLQRTLQGLRAAAAAHAGRIVQATSLGAEDMVLTDLIARHRLAIPLATLDTRELHAPTLALIGRIEQHYGLVVEVYAPADAAVRQFVERHGPLAMRQSVELRKACCALRKLEPLGRMLADREAWITGLRREQSGHRAEVAHSEREPSGRIKLSPLADWSWGDVWHYIALHGVPYNPLHDAFYPSIGCAPCTRAVALGEDFRAGRWWWENDDARECGLHGKAHAAAPAGAARSEAAGVGVSAQADFGAAEVKGAQAPGRSQNSSTRECGLHGKAHAAASAAAARSEAAGVGVSAQADFGAAEVKGAQAPGRSQHDDVKECGLHAAYKLEESHS